ncbi:MAG: MBL fold metallo-hydrolase [Acidobacteriota bacterium]
MNFYIVEAPEGLVCMDIGWRKNSVQSGFEKLGLNRKDVSAVFLTHLHWDHARCLRMFPGTQIFVGVRESPSVFMKKRMTEQPIKLIRDKQVVTITGLTVQGIDTPGHTPGSVSYVVDGRWLFTGDTCQLRKDDLFPFPAWFNWDEKALGQSIRKLAQIKGIECILTAHSGVCRNIENAFRRWRRLVADPPSGEFGL